jgi:two-component system sensor histidine kinase TctE
VAHQLRTPLAGLKTQLEWLAARHAEPDTTQSLKLMLSATERMIRQTNQLLSLARAEPQHFRKAGWSRWRWTRWWPRRCNPSSTRPR